MYIPQVHFNFRCNVDATYFPFGEQNCTAELGSWVHHVNEVGISNTCLTNHVFSLAI